MLGKNDRPIGQPHHDPRVVRLPGQLVTLFPTERTTTAAPIFGRGHRMGRRLDAFLIEELTAAPEDKHTGRLQAAATQGVVRGPAIHSRLVRKIPDRPARARRGYGAIRIRNHLRFVRGHKVAATRWNDAPW